MRASVFVCWVCFCWAFSYFTIFSSSFSENTASVGSLFPAAFKTWYLTAGVRDMAAALAEFPFMWDT